jgi:glycosyltransferase involved in cell wall biosynthesis
MPKTPFFSIIIPTLNEEKYLPHLLQDLSEQSFDLDQLEVIHVDGSSDDKTVAVAKKFAKKLNLTSIVIKQRNVATQRNTGSNKAKGEWILFMDADNRLPTHFLDGIKYQLAKHPQYQVFTSLIKVDSSNQADKAIETAFNLGLMLVNNSSLTGAMGAFIGTHYSVCDEIKFDETQKIMEDAFFIKAAIKKGFNFYIFNEPRWFFSLRRFKKEGALKSVRMIAKVQIRYVTGETDFSENNNGYVMQGGGYYQTPQKTHLLSNLEQYVKSASKRQIQKAKQLLESLVLE